MNDVKGNVKCKPLDQLKNSHQMLLEQMQAISELVHELQQSSFEQECDLKWFQLFERAVIIFSQLKIQIYKEEHFLFPLIKNYVEEDDNILMVMDHEHKTVEHKIVQFIETFQKREGPFTPIEALSLLSCLEIASATLIEHICNEENVLFPLVEEHLVKGEQELLLNKLGAFTRNFSSF
ncbi:MAG TPA: hemerythrin domain-containing protein [Bacillus bacterium]|nr:hemerythrin domain-containing protein [Bacillus sp. (in: firmicutes)]